MLKQTLKKPLKKCRTFWKNLRGEVVLLKESFTEENEDGEDQKNILVFSRLKIDNFGDPIIAECCAYLIGQIAREHGVPVKVTIADACETNSNVMKKKLEGQDIVVFPGGGMNGIVFNRTVLKIMEMLGEQEHTAVFFNAIGILRVNPRKKNVKLLKEILNQPQVKQITTRGDLKTLKKYLDGRKEYPTRLVFDPAMWANEVYGAERDLDSRLIGVGVIRPELFQKVWEDITEQEVIDLYRRILEELDKRGYHWQLFTNGMRDDYQLGVKLLKVMGRDREACLGANVKTPEALVKKIAGYQAVIAARLHANILATSLGVPSVGLVWNDKMNLFAEILGCGERYIQGEKLLDAAYVVDRMEAAMEEGYDMERINKMKKKTLGTIRNIVLYDNRVERGE